MKTILTMTIAFGALIIIESSQPAKAMPVQPITTAEIDQSQMTPVWWRRGWRGWENYRRPAPYFYRHAPGIWLNF